MNTTQKINLAAVAFLIASALLLSVTFFGDTQRASASAPSGLSATLATTSQSAVGTNAIMLFATSTANQCTGRTITTYASPIMLTFSDYAGQTPTGVFGHLQAASTTQYYDGGQYGCQLVKAYSFVSQTITISEFR